MGHTGLARLCLAHWCYRTRTKLTEVREAPASIGGGGCHIDKTGLIEKTNAVLDTRQKFLCVGRPRRFGKSMAADMLAAYYDRDENSAPLFDSLKISRAASYQKYLNQYDVVKVNMQEFLSMTHSMDDMLTTFATKDDVLTLLVHLGYLTYDSIKETVNIPNKEVSQEYVNAISTMSWHV